MGQKLFRWKYLILLSLLLGGVFCFAKSFGWKIWQNNGKEVVVDLESADSTGYDINGSEYKTTTEDPWILIGLDGQNYKYCYVDIYELKHAKINSKIQVYYSEDGNLTEENSVTKTIREGTNCIRLPYNKKIKTLRVDIGTESGMSFQLGKIEISNKIRLTSDFVLQFVIFELLVVSCWLMLGAKEKTIAFVTDNRWEVCIVFFAFLTYCIWSIVIPYNAGPDEYMRYDIPKYICKFGKLPRGDDPLLCDNVWGVSYAYHPYLAYLICALFMKISICLGGTSILTLHVARLATVLFSVGTVIFCIKIARQVFEQKTGRLFVVLVGFLPQFIFISSYVNNDALAIFSTSVVVYYFIRGNKENWTWRDCTGLGIGLAIALAAYRNVYGYLLCSAVFFIIHYIIRIKREKDKRIFWEMIRKGGVICLIVIGISGWWFVRNYVIYDGDILGSSAAKMAKLKYADEAFKPGNKLSLYQQGVSLWEMVLGKRWLAMSVKSFIAGFDYMSLFLQNWLYYIYYGVISIGLIGCFTLVKKKKLKNLLYGFLIINVGIVLIISVYYSYRIDFQPQGRYLLPALIPLMICVAKGIEKVELLLTNRWKGARQISNVIVLFFILSSIWILLSVVIPNYYWNPDLVDDYFWSW